MSSRKGGKEGNVTRTTTYGTKQIESVIKSAHGSDRSRPNLGSAFHSAFQEIVAVRYSARST